jgi:alpha-L-fucosidase
MNLTFSNTIALSRDDSPETLLEKAAHVIPSLRQLTWQALELTAFIHFGINTFTGREWGTGLEDPALFNPSDLDARQWVSALKTAGFKQVVLTAKHHDGFCLWPSRCTDFSVARSPWRNGHGDVLRELVEAARDAGMRVGFYLSPADLHEMEAPGGRYGNGSQAVPSVIPTPCTGDGQPTQAIQTFTFTVDDYNRYYLNQLYELLTEYGPVHEVWFDGANPKPGVPESYNYADWFTLVRALAPDAVMFQGPDIRWVGNENGFARETEWSVLPFKGDPASGVRDLSAPEPDLGSRDRLARALAEGADYLAWSPAEVDVSIRPGWFYHAEEDGQVKSLVDLMQIYFSSVGSNALLLLNIPPDRRGRFAEADVTRLDEFGANLRRIFQPIPGALSADASGSAWTLDLPKPSPFTLVGLQEDLSTAQRVESFAVDAWDGQAWRQIASGTTIAYKRLLRVERTQAQRVRLRILAARLEPAIAAIHLFLD